jgi:single-strand DNA-binding protein
MEIQGRLTADAIIGTTKNNKQVVNFDVAVNDRYKNKAGELITQTEFFRCAFWLGTNVAKVLTKGTIVALSGRVFTNSWIDGNGEAKASLNFNTNNIKILGGGTKQATEQPVAKAGNPVPEVPQMEADDLPF